MPRVASGTRLPHFLHCPKTGGTARSNALWGASRQGKCRLAPHSFRLSSMRWDDIPILFVRNPVARFLSAFAMHEGEHRLTHRWPTAEELALDMLDHRVAREVHKSWIGFRPMVSWIDADPHEKGLVLARTETMDRDYRHICEVFGILAPLPEPGSKRRNEAARPHQELSQDAQAAVKTVYAADLALWKDGLNGL